jgi:subtilase family serine protease
MPRGNQGWALEISLDVQAAHAMCPGCKILLVEASTNSFSNLIAAEDYATSHASVVSNSWGGNEFSSETSSSYDGHFNKAVPITVSSGDNGYGVEYPAASRYVTAVGGTTLDLNSDNTRASESVWSGAGSGCSVYEGKPSWQNDSDCSKRTVADVSADADPSTGAAVYDSYGYSGQSGWFQVGGTSLASPLIAAMYALAGNAATSSYPYAHTSGIYDVTAGSNGSCGGSYLCAASTGYDGPTGLGTPVGVTAF